MILFEIAKAVNSEQVQAAIIIDPHSTNQWFEICGCRIRTTCAWNPKCTYLTQFRIRCKMPGTRTLNDQVEQCVEQTTGETPPQGTIGIIQISHTGIGTPTEATRCQTLRMEDGERV